MHVFENVKPRCLCVSVSGSRKLFISNGGCCGAFASRENIMDTVFTVFKATNHASAQVLIGFRSMFSECAAPLGYSTMMFKTSIVIEQSWFLNMSFT